MARGVPLFYLTEGRFVTFAEHRVIGKTRCCECSPP